MACNRVVVEEELVGTGGRSPGEDVSGSRFRSMEQSGNRLADDVARNCVEVEEKLAVVTGEEARNH